MNWLRRPKTRTLRSIRFARSSARIKAWSRRLLKLANSVFYALPVAVESLEAAVQTVGYTEVQNLVLATSIIKAFDKLPPHLVDVRSFWLHSIACGTASALLAQKWY